MKPHLGYRIIILLFLPLLICCRRVEDGKVLDSLRQIAAETPVYPGFKQTYSDVISKINIAVLTYDYQSAASYDEVKQFYTKELTAKGWSGPEEGINGGGIVNVRFRKGEYSIAVFYDSSAMPDWNYAISYGWKIP